MTKADEAFRTIGEVSDDLDVPKHVLRFWEGRFPQIKPMKRGGGRRFYRPEDVALLKGIHHLLHNSGFTIKGVQRIFKEQGPEAVKGAPEGALAPAKPAAVLKPALKARSVGRPPADPTLAAMRKISAELEACLQVLRQPL